MGTESKRTGVRAVSESTIQIDFTYKTIRCRERIRLKPTPANIKRAENHRAAILDSIERGTFNYADTFPESPNRFMFAEYKGEGYPLKKWLETWLERQEKHLKSSTHDGYRKIVAHILIPELGEKTLTELRRSDVREWCDKQTAGNKRLGNVQSVLRAALQSALDDDLIETNPLYGFLFYAFQIMPQICHGMLWVRQHFGSIFTCVASVIFYREIYPASGSVHAPGVLCQPLE